MHTVETENYKVECYGELQDSSNFHVVCEDEDDDGIWCEGNPHSEDFTFKSWESVVAELSKHFASPIIEISAV